MKIVNNQYDFINNHKINQIEIKDNSLSSLNYELISILLPRIKAYAKRLVFFENIYLNDRDFFNTFIEKKIFNWDSDYDENKIAYDCYPGFNKKLLLHKQKLLTKMKIKTFQNFFKNNSTADITERNLCFFKPNELALQSTKWKKFEHININFLNNYDEEFKSNKFEIFYDIEKFIIKLFDEFFITEQFNILIINSIKRINKIMSFLYFYLDRNLIIPNYNDIICGSDSRILTKLLRYKLIKKKKKLHIFEHGARTLLFKNDYGILKDHRLIFASKYYMTGKGQYNSARKNIDISDKIVLSKNAEPKIKKIINQGKIYKNNKKILYIMDIIASRNKFSEPHDHEAFYYEKIFKCLINFMDQNNYFYKIKPHPDSKMQFKNNYNYIYSNINYLFDKFDILIFDHSVSTAFCEAINTNKKIILLNFSQNNYDTDFDEIVNKRCNLIDTKIDIYGSTLIDFKQLKDAIEDDADINYESIYKTRQFFLP